MTEEGLTPRITNAEQFARQNRVLLLRHEASGVNVDVSLGMLPFEEELITRSQPHALGELRLRLPTPEDLIILKAVAHRPKDLLDIAEVAKSHPQLDRARIKHWVGEFAATLEMPQLVEEVQRLIE